MSAVPNRIGVDATAGRPLLLIAGAPKSGTTSLHRWLSAHPQIAACSVKEPQFFMDPHWSTESAPAGLLACGSGLADYDRLFETSGTWRIDGTVGYMSSAGTPSRVAATGLPAKVVFVLRNPVDRFVSAYNFLRSKHSLPSDGSFEAFLDDQIDGHQKRDPRRRQLTEGFYAEHIARWRRDIGAQHILIVDFDELVVAPKDVCGRVLEVCGLDAAPAEDWAYTVSNQTDTHRNATLDRAWRSVMEGLSVRAQRFPRMYSVLHAVNEHTLARAYARLNRRPAATPTIRDTDLERLSKLYAAAGDGRPRTGDRDT